VGSVLKTIRKQQAKKFGFVGLASKTDVKKLQADIAAKGPSVMPLADDEAVQRAKKRATAMATSAALCAFCRRGDGPTGGAGAFEESASVGWCAMASTVSGHSGSAS